MSLQVCVLVLASVMLLCSLTVLHRIVACKEAQRAQRWPRGSNRDPKDFKLQSGPNRALDFLYLILGVNSEDKAVLFGPMRLLGKKKGPKPKVVSASLSSSLSYLSPN